MRNLKIKNSPFSPEKLETIWNSALRVRLTKNFNITHCYLQMLLNLMCSLSVQMLIPLNACWIILVLWLLTSTIGLIVHFYLTSLSYLGSVFWFYHSLEFSCCVIVCVLVWVHAKGSENYFFYIKLRRLLDYLNWYDGGVDKSL